MIISEQLLSEQRNWQAEQAKLADDRHEHTINMANRGAILVAVSTVISGVLAVGVTIWATYHTQSPAVHATVLPAPTANVTIPERPMPTPEVKPIPRPDKPEIKSTDSDFTKPRQENE